MMKDNEYLFIFDIMNFICPVCSSELFEDYEENIYHYISCSNCSFKEEYSKYFDDEKEIYE